uniref:Uncharacterized protein n=1 Tax=Melopsittacus undulatus TaxID=13146 RepID=A0A8V5FVL6_MELUD
MLQDCSHLGWGQHYCGHEQDVGVTCTDALELRLVEGSGPCAGKVEVKLRGQWGAVSDDTWTMEDAEVICQQLGCGSATKAYIDGSRADSDDRPINVVMVNCHGHEKAFWECKVGDWGPYSDLHDFDTGVVCQGFSRLVGGDGSCSGLLQVRQGRAWASVCEDAVDLNAARVVCRELGCGSVLAVVGPGLFPMGSEPQWDTGFECTGTELLLSACKRRARSTQGCSAQASIICSSYGGFRLVNHSSHCAGRVEVMEGGTWGSLCASAWDLPDAHVLCHHLGCGSASSVPPGGSFGSGNGTLRVDAFGCSGTERVPSECPVVGLGEPSCPPGHAAAVECSGVTDSLRLLEGQTRCDGRLEVTTSPSSWAAVSAGLRDPQTGSVACRELDCGEPERVYPVPAPSAMGLQEVQCAGSEDALAQCNRSVTAVAPRQALAVVCSGECPGRAGGCRPRRQQPRCIPSVSRRQPAAEAGGGPRSLCGTCGALRERRLEPRVPGRVGHPGRHRRVPAAPLRGSAGGLRLRSLRARSGSAVDGSRWLHRIRSFPLGLPSPVGERLPERRWGRCCVLRSVPCTRTGGGGGGVRAPGAAVGPVPCAPVSAVCSGQCRAPARTEGGARTRSPALSPSLSPPGHLSLRLTGGSGRCRGHLELLHNGTWGRVCADGTSPATAAAACRQLGCGDRGILGAAPAPLPAPAWLAWVRCPDGARSLWLCPSAPWRLQPCAPGGDAHVVCAEDGAEEGGVTPTPGSSCPHGGACTDVPTATPPLAVPTVPTVPTVSTVPTVLNVVLGVLLCLALAGLALQWYRAWAARPEPGNAVDAVYEELDYTVVPEYQQVPSRPGSPTEGSETKLPYYTAGDVEESDPSTAPGPPALPEDGPPDGYDDAEAVPEELLGTGDTPEGVALVGWSRPPPGGTGDPPEHPPTDTGYDDAEVGTLGTLL